MFRVQENTAKTSGVESELDGVGDTGVSTFGDLSGDCTSEKKG